MGSDFVKHLGLALRLDDRSGSRHHPPEPFVRDRTHLPYETDEREPPPRAGVVVARGQGAGSTIVPREPRLRVAIDL
jgi:hypothetical protein